MRFDGSMSNCGSWRQCRECDTSVTTRRMPDDNGYVIRASNIPIPVKLPRKPDNMHLGAENLTIFATW